MKNHHEIAEQAACEMALLHGLTRASGETALNALANDLNSADGQLVIEWALAEFAEHVLGIERESKDEDS